MARQAKRHDAGTFKPHVRRGDEVIILAGRSLGDRGRVVSVDPQRERAVVEGVNLITKHQRARATQSAAARQQSGRVEKPAPIHISNLMVVCPGCGKPARLGHSEMEGKSVRTCKRCGASVESGE